MKLTDEEIKRKAEIIQKMSVIEQEEGGFSNIPRNHETYWNLRNEFGKINVKENR